MRTLLAPDAKPEGGPPSNPPQTDAHEAESSTAATAQTETSEESTTTPLQEAVAKEFAESKPAAEEKPEVESDNRTELEEKKTSDGKEEPSADGEAEKAETTQREAPKDDEGKELPPFHEHPRWKEMVEERNALREQVKSVEQGKKYIEQQTGIVNYCLNNGISQEQFQQGLELMALINTNPAEAAKRIKPIMEQLGEFDGSKLPPDLEEAVADGKIELEYAQRLAQAEAQRKFGQQQTKKSQEQLEQERAQQMAEVHGQALSSWEQTTMKNDPDFKPKAKADEVDGMYEYVVDRFSALIAKAPPRTAQDVVKLAEQAYNSVKKTFATRLTPKQPVRKPVDSVSSRNAKVAPKNVTEAVLQEMGL